jgi:23S rRNA U2552 (ribose-2'-O)-methylase RlmE/FtsJ
MIRSILKSAVGQMLGPTRYEILIRQVPILRSPESRRTAKRTEHWDSFFAPESAPRQGGGELERAFYQHDGRIITKWHHYLEVYERFLSPFKNRETIRLLEIGVDQGGSLQLWRKYLGKNAKIAGLDINPKTEFSEENIRVFIGSQDDPLTLDRALEWLGGIDVVIDDGSHIVSHQMAALNYLFPRLSEGGLYICEDLHTNYWSEFEGGFRKRQTFIERMKRAVDDINQWHHRFGAKDATLAHKVFGIHFYDSMVVLEKRSIARPFHEERGMGKKRPRP